MPNLKSGNVTPLRQYLGPTLMYTKTGASGLNLTSWNLQWRDSVLRSLQDSSLISRHWRCSGSQDWVCDETEVALHAASTKRYWHCSSAKQTSRQQGRWQWNRGSMDRPIQVGCYHQRTGGMLFIQEFTIQYSKMNSQNISMKSVDTSWIWVDTELLCTCSHCFPAGVGW